MITGFRDLVWSSELDSKESAAAALGGLGGRGGLGGLGGLGLRESERSSGPETEAARLSAAKSRPSTFRGAALSLLRQVAYSLNMLAIYLAINAQLDKTYC